MTKLIPLTRGFSAIVDDADFDWLSQWKWLILGGRYAARWEVSGGAKNIITMHRLIMNAPAHLEVDHRNRNKLDCQRDNLRLATHAQNMQNKAKSHFSSASAFKGVRRERLIWTASITVNGKPLRLGSFSSELDAAIAYDAAARFHHGEFACLNCPEHYGRYTYQPSPKPVFTSQYRGVSWENNRKGWRAVLKVNQKGIHLGVFASEIEAAHAYDAKAVELLGSRARLNFPQEHPNDHSLPHPH